VKILIDIGHPAHVHFFRNAISLWRQAGDEVLITSRDKDVTLRLLEEYGLAHRCLSRSRSTRWSLGIELLVREYQLFWLARRFRPDVMSAIAGTFMVHVGRLLRIPTVVFYDTEHAHLQNERSQHPKVSEPASRSQKPRARGMVAINLSSK
jgi:hypothetical protein